MLAIFCTETSCNSTLICALPTSLSHSSLRSLNVFAVARSLIAEAPRIDHRRSPRRTLVPALTPPAPEGKGAPPRGCSVGHIVGRRSRERESRVGAHEEA